MLSLKLWKSPRVVLDKRLPIHPNRIPKMLNALRIDWLTRNN